MKFCPECGTKVEGLKFCPECGYKTTGSHTANNNPKNKPLTDEQTLFEFSTFMFGLEDKKKSIAKGIDLSLPQFNYTLTTERLLIVKKGYVGSKKEELELYKIKDVTVNQGLKDKLLGIGNIEISSVDESTPQFVIKQIKDPEEIKERIRTAVKNRKTALNIGYRQEI